MTRTPICPSCGCSLVRLGLKDEDAARYRYADIEYRFCCQGCVDLFTTDPERYLDEIRDVIVCPSCLAEKPLASTVSFEHEGSAIHFCRCPHCLQDFKNDPQRLLRRLSGNFAKQ